MCSDKMRKSRSFIFSIVALGALLLSPEAAMAFEMEFYTYGGFPEVVSSFNKCALIFSADSFKVLLPSVFCLSLAAGLIGAALYKLQTAVRDEGLTITKPEGIYSVIINALIGSALFIGLITPKGTLHIYDPTENAYQAVGGIPVLAVAGAGVGNLIERTFVNIMETAGDPLGYSKQSGMKGIQVLNSLMARGDESPSNEGTLGLSLVSYTSDCVVWELARTGTALTVDELKNKTSSIVTSFGKATSASAFTTVYDPALSTQGEMMSCTDAWTNILARANNVGPGDLFANTKKRACGDAGYSVYDPDPAKAATAYTECTTSTDALIKAIDGGWTFDKFMLEMFFSHSFWVAISKDNPAGFSNQKTTVRNMSAIQEYLGTIGQKRGIVTAFAAVLLPFVSLLLPTKYWPKAVGTIVTAFMICPIWGMLDAMTTDFYLSRAISTWAGFLGNNWGVDQQALWSSSAMKELSTWGLYVAASFGIALTMARALGGGLTSVAGGFGGVGAASSEGALERGRTGTGAMNREAVATGAGLAGAATMGANGYALSQSMPNWDGGAQSQVETARLSGGYKGNESLLDQYGTSGLTQANADITESSFATGAAAAKAEQRVADADGLKNGTTRAGARDHIEGFKADNAVAGQYATENMYKTLHDSGLFKGDQTDFMRQLKSNGSVAMADGSTLSMSQGSDGRWQATSTFTGNGYTGTSAMKDGRVENTKIANGDAWKATFDRDGHILASDNRALSGSISTSAGVKASQSAGESWNQQVALAQQKGTALEHSTATQQTNQRIASWSKEMSSTLAEKLVKSGAIKQSEQVATERAISASLSADPIKAAGFMAGMLGGPATTAAGAATAGLMSLAGKAIGLKAEVAGSYAKRSTSGTNVETGLSSANEQSVQNAVKEAVQESSTTSRTLADIRKDSLSQTVTDSNGNQQNYGRVLNYDESKGYTARTEMETGFIKEVSERPEYKHLATEQERIAAANNDLSKVEDREKVGAEFNEYLEKKAMEDGRISEVKNRIETAGVARQEDFKKDERVIGSNVDKGQKLVTGPGTGPKFSLAPEVHRQAAQFGSDIQGGEGFVAGSKEKIGIFNSNTPTPEEFGRQKHVTPSVGLGTAQLNVSGGQKTPPPTDFERVGSMITSSANAVYNSTPVQVGVKIGSGLTDAAPKIVRGLGGLDMGAVAGDQTPRINTSPQEKLAPEVHRQVAQFGSDIQAGEVVVAGSKENIGIINSNTPTPGESEGQKHVTPPVGLETSQLNISGGQTAPPPTDFERVGSMVTSSANAVDNSTPVQVGSGLTDAAPIIVRGLGELDRGAVAGDQTPRINTSPQEKAGPPASM